MEQTTTTHFELDYALASPKCEHYQPVGDCPRCELLEHVAGMSNDALHREIRTMGAHNPARKAMEHELLLRSAR